MGKKEKPLRIFLGLSEISGLYQGLEQGFRQLKIAVTRLDLANHPFQYQQQKKNLLVSLIQKGIAKIPHATLLQKIFWKGVISICKLLIFFWATIRHDVFIFSYGTSFFRLQELKLIKLFGKKIIFQFHGSDSRPPFIDGTLIHHHPTFAIAELTTKKKKQIKCINHYADAIIDIPPMGLFHERPFINWLRVGLTVSITSPPTLKNKTAPPIKILHAPSNLIAKGTHLIDATVGKLQEMGYNIELIKIHNQPHEKVKEALSKCDFVIDQLFADYPMPGFATESAWYAKPTIICGYATQLWQELLPKKHMPPTYYCHPDELEQAIKLFCDDSVYRQAQGLKAFEFVKSQWSPVEIAKRYLEIINDTVPSDWYCYPNEIQYTHGCCVDESTLKKFLHRYINEQGKSSLHLTDKPQLEALFLQFADIS